MSKILLRADAHCHPHSGSAKRAVECLDALRWSYDVALARGCKWVIDLGDVFHERHHIDTWTYNEVYAMAKKYKDLGVDTCFVLGNHDMYFRESATHHAIRAFETLFKVVADPATVELCGRKFDVFPYVEKNPQRALNEAFPSGSRAEVLFFHAAFDGAIMSSASGMRRKSAAPASHDMHEDEVSESLDPGGLSGWKMAWGGHYHMPQLFSTAGECRAEYVGSLLQHNKGETGERKRVVVLDVDTLEVAEVFNDVSPVFLKIDGDTDLPEDLDVSRARVCVYSNDMGAPSTQAVCRELRKRGALLVLTESKGESLIDPEVQRQAIHGAAAMVREGDTMIRRYAKLQAPADLRQDTLVEIGRKIVRMAETGVVDES